jgi:hypothetical protein
MCWNLERSPYTIWYIVSHLEFLSKWISLAEVYKGWGLWTVGLSAGLMMNDADTRPRHAVVCSPPLLVSWCGEWRHTISGPIHSVSFVTQVQLGWIMDMWRFCSPIGSDCCCQINGRLGLRIVAYGGIINLHEQIQPIFALRKIFQRQGKQNTLFAACRKSCREEYGPTAICTWWIVNRLRVIPLLAKCPDRVNYPNF